MKKTMIIITIMWQLFNRVYGKVYMELCEYEQIMKNDLIDCYREAEHGIALRQKCINVCTEDIIVNNQKIYAA